jgi:hypothetical protein
MPLIFEELSEFTSSKKNYKNFYRFVKNINPNASVIDRTNNSTITPFPIEVLDKIPENYNTPSKTFEEIVDSRAAELLKTGKTIRVLYSGGLDSTVIVLSLWRCISNGIGSFEQVIVCCNTPSIIENPDCWKYYILPFFNIEEITKTLKNISVDNIYVMGENADQIFGSETILHNLETINQNITHENLKKFMIKKGIETDYHEYFFNVYDNLVKDCPIKLNKMSELMWWINFSCRWQADIFTTLCFTNLFKEPVHLSTFENNFRAFYNTLEFQHLSLYSNLEKWGDIPHPQNYKLAIRNYIKKFQNQLEYADIKIKSPSLYRALIQHSIKSKMLVTDNTHIFSLSDDEIISFLKYHSNE